MTDATELDEAAIRVRLEAATPGPWEHVRVPFRDTASHSVKRGQQVLALVGWEREEAERAPADAEFIAHARTDVGLLLTALDEAEFHIQQLTESRDRAERLAEAAEVRLDTCVDSWHDGRSAGPCPGCGYLRPQDRLLAAEAQVERLHFDLDREARARQAAEGALAAVRALLDDTQVPCACAENRYPGYIDDENWEPEWPGDTRSLTGRGYLDCPWCDGEGNRTPYMPSREDLLAALATPTTPDTTTTQGEAMTTTFADRRTNDHDCTTDTHCCSGCETHDGCSCTVKGEPDFAPTSQTSSAIEDRANVHREALIDTESAYQQRKGWSMSCLWCDYVTPVEPTRAKALAWMQKHYNETIPEGAEIR